MKGHIKYIFSSLRHVRSILSSHSNRKIYEIINSRVIKKKKSSEILPIFVSIFFLLIQHFYTSLYLDPHALNSAKVQNQKIERETEWERENRRAVIQLKQTERRKSEAHKFTNRFTRATKYFALKVTLYTKRQRDIWGCSIGYVYACLYASIFFFLFLYSIMYMCLARLFTLF